MKPTSRSRKTFPAPSPEVTFIDQAVRRHRRVMPSSPEGPGDDAAVRGRHLHTADLLVEGVHFLAGEPPFLLGRKALAVNLSDIAAMGGRPLTCLLSLGLPAGSGLSGSRLLDGFASMAAEHGLDWIGGDTVASPGGIVLSVAVTGERSTKVLLRSGARPGDGIYVTGALGASAAGRALLSAGAKVRDPESRDRGNWASLPPAEAASRILALIGRGRPARARTAGRKAGAAGARAATGSPALSSPSRLNKVSRAELIASHLDPVPRIAAGRFLAGRKLASAAIDLSDGLSTDLWRVCRASGVGARILADAIPISHATRSWARHQGADPLELALNGGEDYELLFTAPSSAEEKLSAWGPRDGTGPILIGRITPRSGGVRLEDAAGRGRQLTPGGYDAFRNGARKVRGRARETTRRR